MLRKATWRKRVSALRKNFPVDGSVRVVRRPCKRLAGFTTTDGCGNYTIKIDSRLSWDAQIDTLIHEWAHVLAIAEAYTHRGRWTKHYADVYDFADREFSIK